MQGRLEICLIADNRPDIELPPTPRAMYPSQVTHDTVHDGMSQKVTPVDELLFPFACEKSLACGAINHDAAHITMKVQVRKADALQVPAFPYRVNLFVIVGNHDFRHGIPSSFKNVIQAKPRAALLKYRK
jgi:hypothetical protein